MKGIRESSAPICLIKFIHLMFLKIFEASLLLIHKEVILIGHISLDVLSFIFMTIAALGIVSGPIFLSFLHFKGRQNISGQFLLLINSNRVFIKIIVHCWFLTFFEFTRSDMFSIPSNFLTFPIF